MVDKRRKYDPPHTLATWAPLLSSHAIGVKTLASAPLWSRDLQVYTLCACLICSTKIVLPAEQKRAAQLEPCSEPRSGRSAPRSGRSVGALLGATVGLLRSVGHGLGLDGARGGRGSGGSGSGRQPRGTRLRLGGGRQSPPWSPAGA